MFEIKVLIQVGNLGERIISNLIYQISDVEFIENVYIIRRYPGKPHSKVTSYYPPKYIAKHAFPAILYEFLIFIFLSVSKRPDIVSGYLIFPHGLIAFLIGKLIGCPIIISLIAGPVELFAPGRSPLGVKFENELPWYGNLLIKLLCQTDIIITTGTFTKDFLVKKGIPEEKVFPIISIPDSPHIYSEKKPKIYDIVYVGRLAPVKNISTVLYAIYEIKKSYAHISACIVGDGPCRDQLIMLSKELGIQENIKFAGFQRDVNYYYNVSKIFMLVSEREGFPTVFLEAMSCGLPSVVSNCGDITDLAKNGFNCIVINSFNDYKAFSDAILFLLNNEEAYQAFSKNALQTISDASYNTKYEWTAIIEKLSKNF